MNQGSNSNSNKRVLAAFLGICAVAAIASVSGVVGALVTLGAGAGAYAVLTGRIPADRKIGIGALVVAVAAGVGTVSGYSERSRLADEAPATVSPTETTRPPAQTAPGTVSPTETTPPPDQTAPGTESPAGFEQARADVASAREALAAGDFDRAHALAESARARLDAAPGSDALRVEADAMFRDSANLSAIHAAMLDARDAIRSTPDTWNSPQGWAMHLETLALALRQAPPVAVARFGGELESLASALDARRERFRRQVERAAR